MAGIPFIHRDGKTVLHPAIWASPEDVPVLFLVGKEGATALAHPDWVAELLYEVKEGDLDLADAWDWLMVKTPSMAFPEICTVAIETGEGERQAVFRDVSLTIQHRMGI